MAPVVAAAQTVPAAAAAAAAAVVAVVIAADMAQSEHAAAATAVVAAVAVVQAEADSVGEVAGCKSLDDARSCFHGGALQLLETQHAQWRDTGGCCHHLHSADAEEDHLPRTELERVLGSDHRGKGEGQSVQLGGCLQGQQMHVKSDPALGGSQLQLQMHLDPHFGRLRGTHMRSSRQIAWGYPW